MSRASAARRPPDPLAERAALAEELAYLRTSLEDLDREHGAGDVGEADYERLAERYRRRAGEVEQELAVLPPPSAGESAPGAPSGTGTARASTRRRNVLSSRRARSITGWGAFGFLLAAAVLLALAVARAGPFTGPPQLSKEVRIQVMLAEADVLGSRGDVTQALATYDSVLALDPTQPEALANGGWLARVAGIAQHDPTLVRNGDAEIEAAVQSDPRYALARAYDGVLLFRDRREAHLAVAQFDAMLRDHPSPTLLRSVGSQARAAFHAAGLAPPRPLGSSASS